MTEKIIENNDTQISVEQASEMFGVLFEKPENKLVVSELFKWLVWVAREQKVQETIKIAKWGLQELKNTTV